jgi:threonine dehydratase
MALGPEDVRAARGAVERVARRTPILTSRTLSDRVGGLVSLKAENLQFTGSFKVRGAAAKLASLGPERCAAGVVCASAGNHAQSVAAAAHEMGVPCEVFVPTNAPIAKHDAALGWGAVVHVGGDRVEDCLVAARARAQEGGLAFVHPYDDPVVVAGQGSIGLELLEEVPDLAQVVVPVGGGGLAAGIALAVRDAGVRVVGVRAAAPETGGLTIADGIAVKAPGEVTRPLLDELVGELVYVEEDEIAEAMVLLMERAKLVVEGAGAVGVAALLAGHVPPVAGRTVALLSGGNVDAGLLATIARRHETEAGRRLVLLTRVDDRPGGLATMLACIAKSGANVVDVSHVREGLDLHVRETAVELVLETRGREHAERVLDALDAAGYPAQVLR